MSYHDVFDNLKDLFIQILIWHSFILTTTLKMTCIDHVDNTVEAVIRRCSSKQVFLKISQISQENTYVGVSFSQVLSCEIRKMF